MAQSRETQQRRKLDTIVPSMHGFFGAEDLHERARKDLPALGIATVYRYLRAAERDGTVHAYQCERKTVYSARKQSHCHFTCDQTGKVIHFDVDSLDFLKKKIPGTIHSFSIEVRGVCKECK